MGLFAKKSEPEPAAVRLPVLYEPPLQSLPASKAPVDERALRARIWQGGFIGPDLARACGLSVSALVEFAHGVTSVSVTQQAAIAKFVGLGDGSVSGLQIIRDAMERRCRNGRPDWGDTATTRNRVRPGGRTVDPNDELDVPSPEIEDDSRSLRHTANVQAFLAGDDQALSLVEINAFLGPGACYDPETDRLRKIDNATSMGGARPPPAKGRPIEEILGPNMEPMRDAPGYQPKGASIVTVYDPLPPKPARGLAPGWAV